MDPVAYVPKNGACDLPCQGLQHALQLKRCAVKLTYLWTVLHRLDAVPCLDSLKLDIFAHLIIPAAYNLMFLCVFNVGPIASVVIVSSALLLQKLPRPQGMQGDCSLGGPKRTRLGDAHASCRAAEHCPKMMQQV